MKHPCYKVNTQKYDYAEPRRGGIIIALGVNPGYQEKRDTRFGGIFAAWQAKIMTKQKRSISGNYKIINT